HPGRRISLQTGSFGSTTHGPTGSVSESFRKMKSVVVWTHGTPRTELSVLASALPSEEPPASPGWPALPPALASDASVSVFGRHAIAPRVLPINKQISRKLTPPPI